MPSVTLNVTSKARAGIRAANSNVWLTDSNVTINTESCPIDLDQDNLLVTGLFVIGGTLTAKTVSEKDFGINAYSIRFEDGAVVNVEAKATAVKGGLAVRIENAELTASSASEDHAAIYCINDVLIENGTVNALGAGTGINCGHFSMQNSSLTARGYSKHAIVAHYDGITVGEICDKLMLDNGTLSPLLKKMQQTGYIERKRSQKDMPAHAVRRP